MKPLSCFGILMVMAGAVAGGCRRGRPAATAPAAREEEPATRPAPDAPEVPLDVDEEALVSKVLVKDTTVAERHKKAKYRADPLLPAGAVTGVCYVPSAKGVYVPRDLPIWPAGENAIRDPAEGELAYYEKHAPRRLHPLGRGRWNGAQRFGVGQTVLIFRGIKSGRRPRLSRPSFVVNYRNGNIEVPQAGYNHGRGNICFAPRFERILFANTEFFACRIEVRHAESGKVFFEAKLPGYRDPKHPGARYGEKWGMVPLRLVQTRALMETGMYTITCRKHPWHKAYLFVVDNPYVCVSSLGLWGKPSGSFAVQGIPEGEYKVDVWHPEYELVKKTFTVKIHADKTTELPIEFKPPPLLKSPIVPTTHDVRQWVCAGPFENRDVLIHPPEKERQKIDFNATYKGLKGAEVRWQPINADARGVVSVWGQLAEKPFDSAWYLAAEIASPTAQPVTFGVGMTEGGKLWINGELVHTRHGAHNNPWGSKNERYLAWKLKAGTNALLARLGTFRAARCGMSLTYRGEGLKVVRPGGPRLAAGYVPDAAAPSGVLKGLCYVPFDKPVHLPRLSQLDLSGPLALKAPAEGELEHYTGPRRPARGVLLSAFDPKQKRYGVRDAVVMLKDVRTGRRPRLLPAKFRIDGGIGDLRVVLVHYEPRYSRDMIGFHPPGKPLVLAATDVFGYELLLKQAASGAVVSSTPVPAYKDKYFPAQPHDPARGGMSAPVETFLAPVKDPGRYLLTGKRHPWVRAHLFVATHPYVGVTDSLGGFTMADVPAGKHTVEVWHPDFQPEKKTFEVEIAPGKETLLNVPFKVPEVLSKPPMRTDQAIIEWVCVGPFKAAHEKPNPPEEKADFKAEYPRKGRSSLRWRRVNADRNGYLDLYRLIGRYHSAGTWYLAAVIDSPKDQLLTLGVGAVETVKIFLNGKCIYDRPYHRGWRKDEDYVLGDLKAGGNVLVVKLTHTRQGPALSVTFKAAGAKAAVPPDPALLPPYIRDDRLPAGQLKGVCYVPFEKDVPLPRRFPLDLSGPKGVRRPAEGEVPFFQRNLPAGVVPLGRFDEPNKRYPVAQAALILRDVKSGRRFPLQPTGLTVSYGSSQPETAQNQNYGSGQIAFGRTGESVALATGEVFPAHLVLTKAGAAKSACEVGLKAYADSRYPGKCYGQIQHMHLPRPVSTPPIAEPGRYLLTCRRHPWRRGHLFVVHHPYVGVSDGGGRFTMDEVPAGKYTLEVWHADFEAVKPAAEVQIAAGKPAEVKIEFKPPAVLTNPPPVPEMTIDQWAGIGPFQYADKPAEPHPPEKGIDFKAACEGKGKARVRWRLLKSDAAGLLNLSALAGEKVRQSTWYLAALLEAPRSRRVVFGVGSPEMAKVWLNGKLICDWPHRTNSWAKNQDYVVGNLQAGRNTLLVRADCLDRNCGAFITYDAKDVKATVPPDRHLREGYVHDPTVAGGRLTGACYVPFDKPVHIPRLVQLELSGAMALASPQEGELARYRGPHRPARGVRLGGFDAGRKRYGVRHAAVVLPGIRSGRRLPLKPNAFQVDPHTGQLRVVSEGHNYSRGSIAFTPTGEDLALIAADIFNYHFLLQHVGTGKPAFDGAVGAYKDPKHPGLPYNPHRSGMARAKTVRMGPIVYPGRHLLSATRRPWCRGHVFVADNPYVAATDAGGSFAVDDLPPGKHVVEIWHPDFEPVKKIHQIEIAAGKTTELNVAFKVPDALSRPPVYADRTIIEWLYAGPFVRGHETVYPPEQTLDLSADYETKHGAVTPVAGKKRVRWQRVNATRDGRVDLWRAVGPYVRDATWYAYAEIASPADQPVTLAVGSSEQCRLFLNGRLIYEYAAGHRWRKDDDVVLAPLKAGRNVLLAKITASGEPSVSVSFKAAGAKCSVPQDARFRPRYIRDDRKPAGNLQIHCYVPFPKQVPLPPCWPMRPAGRYAIRKPTKGELAHFETDVPTRPVWLGRFDAVKKRYPVIQAALMLRGVTSGGRSPLQPTGFTVNYASSQLATGREVNYGRYDFAFAPTGVPLGLSTGEVFGAELVLAAGGRAFGQYPLPAYEDKRFEGKGYGEVGGMSHPKGVATAPLPAGSFTLTCKRHPWKRADLVVSDHPYVGLTDGAGNVRLDNVPAGKHTLDVLHGEFRPVKRKLPVEVAAGKTTSVEIAFQPPAFLSRPPATPQQHAAQWACVGPFPQDHTQQRAYPPEKDLAKGIDFKAVYEGGDPARLGKEKTKVPWRLYNADRDGLLNLSAQLADLTSSTVWYAAATLTSPRDQKVLFGLGTPEASKVWINGELARYWPHRTGSGAGNQGYFLAPLKRGANPLLVRVNSIGHNAMTKLTWETPQVKAAAPPGRHLVRPYMWADTPAVGTVKGVCYVPFDKPVHIPRMVQIAGVAVRGPEKGEGEYYAGPGRPGRPVWLGRFDAANKRYAVRRAVLVVQGVRAGRRLPLRPMRLQVNPGCGWIETYSRGVNYSSDLVAFTPVGERVELMATDVFGYHLQVADAAGKVVSQTPLEAYKDEKRPRQPYRSGMAAPKVVALPAIDRPGRFLLTCKRHPWVRGHLFASHHAYVALSDDGGNFAIDSLPVGRHTVAVWHPDFAPAAASFQVHVAADKPAEVKVPFKVPPLLARAVPYTDQAIIEWVFAGPFDRDHYKPFPPEQKTDFRARYEGAGKAPVAWRRVNADRKGYLNLLRYSGRSAGPSTWYCATLLNSPRPQPVTLGVGSSEQCRLWLNGTLIYDRPDGHGWSKDEDIVKGALKAGANVLLAKLTRHGGGPELSVAFKAPGAKAAPPPDARLRPPYLWDDRAKTAQLHVRCYVPFDKQVALPSQLPLALTGANAIRGPKPGENDYFTMRPPTRPVWIGGFDGGKKRYGAGYAAVVLHGVKAGRRYPFTPTGFTVNYASGQLETAPNHNYGRHNMAFGPVGEALALATGEIFPSHLVVTHAPTRRAVCQVPLPAYKDDKHPGKCYGEVGGTPAPKVAYTPPLAAAGRYLIACKRHPWKRGHLFVVDNPYAGLADGNGAFRMDDVPPGKYTLDLWHPDLEPVKRRLPVEIQPGKAASVEVAFKVPAILTNPPPVPDTPVTSWAFLGIFDDKSRPDPAPEKKLDLAAKVKGRGGAGVAWKSVEANDGRIDMAKSAGKAFKSVANAHAYLCAHLQAQKARSALFGLQADDAVTVWLNGRCIYSGASGMAVGQLKAGRNVLLARLANGGGAGHLVVKYPGEGVKASAPALP